MGSKRGRSPDRSPETGQKRARLGASPEALKLNLKIQRLRGENFVVSIDGKDLITQLKEEVLRILRTGVSSEVYAEITNLRLIYKGKVLVDAKSIEFYKIQNDDTIQLVPFHRRFNTAPSQALSPAPAAASSGGSQSEEKASHRQHISQRRGPLTLVTFSTSVAGGVGRGRDDRRQALIRRQQQQPPPGLSSSVLWTTRPSSPVQSTRRLHPRRVTPRSLRSFKELLQTTLNCVSSTVRRGINCQEGIGELADQLNDLMREAIPLRSRLRAQSRVNAPVAFVATAEDGVFSLVENRESGSLSQRSPINDASAESAPLANSHSSPDMRTVANRFRQMRLRPFNFFRMRGMREADLASRQRTQNGLGHYTRWFTAERLNPQIVSRNRDRGRIRPPIEVSRALVVRLVERSVTQEFGVGGLANLASPTVSELPEAHQHNSGDALPNNPSNLTAENPAPRPSRRERSTSPEVGNADGF